MQPTHAHAASHQAEQSHSHHHIVPFKVNMAVGITLLVLTAVTVWVAQFDFGAMNMIVAMTVATVKAGLVVAYFMHLRYDNRFFFTMLLVCLIALTVFIVFTMIDQKSRTSIYDYEMQEIRKNAKMYEKKGLTSPKDALPAKH
ncbi:MAG: cytochrome C oxidase subunit IV family protein [Chloroherpetonaceae bacterium]